MKKHRQLIALNLVLVLLLSLFPGVAFAAETEAAAEPTEQIAQIEQIEQTDAAEAAEELEPLHIEQGTVQSDPVVEPEPTVDPDLVQLRPGETVTFIQGENDRSPKFWPQVDRAGIYSLRFTPPEGTGYTVGYASAANMMVNSSGLVGFSNRTDRMGISFALAPGDSAAFWISKPTYGAEYHGAYDVSGEWSVTLEEVSSESHAFGERFSVQKITDDYVTSQYVCFDIPETGNYYLDLRGLEAANGTLYVFSDAALKTSVQASEDRMTAVGAEAGDRLIVQISSWRDGTALVDQAPSDWTPFGAQGNNLSWRVDPQTSILTIRGSGSMGTLSELPWEMFSSMVSTVVLESGVTDVADGAFQYMSIARAELADSLTRIGSKAFYGTRISTIELPDSVTEIGEGAFAAHALSAVRASGASFKVVNGVLYSADGTTLVCYPAMLGASSFEVPDGVKTVLPNAFDFVEHLSTVTVPASVESFGFSSGRRPISVIYFCGTDAQAHAALDERWFNSMTSVMLFEELTGDEGASITYDVGAYTRHPSMFYRPDTAGVYEADLINVNVPYDNLNYYSSYGNMILYVSSSRGSIQHLRRPTYDQKALYLLQGGERAEAYIDSTFEGGTFELSFKRREVPQLALGANAVQGGSESYCLFTAPKTAWYSFECVDRDGNALELRLSDGVASGSSDLHLTAGTAAAVSIPSDAAATVTVSESQLFGPCGKHASWALDDSGVLTISGTGAMYDYSNENPAPWNRYYTEVNTLIVEDGITAVGSWAFVECHLNRVELADSVKTIGDNAFGNCGTIASVRLPAQLEQLSESAFAWTGVEAFTLPASNTHFVLEDGVLYDSAHETLYHCVTGAQNRIVVPDGVKTISEAAFFGCYSLNVVQLPESIQSIQGYVFTQSGVYEIHFNGSAVEWYLIDGSEEVYCTVCFARESQAPEIAVGSHTEASGSAVYSFTAPETGVYRLAAPNAFVRMLNTSGESMSRRYAAEYVSMFRLTKGMQVYLVLRSGEGVTSLNWTLGLVEVPALTSGEQTSTFSNEAKVFRFTPDVSGAFTFQFDVPCFLSVLDSDFQTYWSQYSGYNAISVDLNAGEQYYLFVRPDSSVETMSWSFGLKQPPEPITVELGENTVYVDGEVLCPFTPAGSGTYRFTGTTYGVDTYARLYGYDGDLLTEDDDSAGNLQFLIEYDLEAGKTYYLGVSYLGGGSGDLTFTAEALSFTFTKQPQDYAGKLGDTARFSVTAAGEGLTYQWQYQNPGSSVWKNSASTTDSVTCYVTAERVGRLYRCIVTDASGQSITSEAAKIILMTPLEITAQPQDYTGFAGETARFTVAATGDGLTYQWQFKDVDGEWRNSSSVKDSASCVLTAARSGRLYRCVITDAYGNSITSESAMLRVRTPLAVTQQPQNSFTPVGATAVFTVAAEGDDLTYQWQYQNPGSSAWKKSASTSDSVSCYVTAERDGRLYRCVITDAYGESVTTESAKITVVTALKITQQPQDFTGASGDTATFTVKATGDGLQYQWQYQNPGSEVWKDSAATTNTATCALTTARSGRLYRCIITDAYGNTVTTRSAKITVMTALKITAQPQDFTGVSGATATFTVKATGDGLTYQWQYQNPGSSVWKDSSATTNTATCTLTTARNGRLYRCVITDAYGNSVTTRSAKITVAAALKITAQPQDFTGVSGATATFTVKATGDGLTYQWQYQNPGSTAWKDSSATTNTATCTLTTARNGRLYRCIITDAYGNTVTSSTAKIIVTA